jgi:hypothetical protein
MSDSTSSDGTDTPPDVREITNPAPTAEALEALRLNLLSIYPGQHGTKQVVCACVAFYEWCDQRLPGAMHGCHSPRPGRRVPSKERCVLANQKLFKEILPHPEYAVLWEGAVVHKACSAAMSRSAESALREKRPCFRAIIHEWYEDGAKGWLRQRLGRTGTHERLLFASCFR